MTDTDSTVSARVLAWFRADPVASAAELVAEALVVVLTFTSTDRSFDGNRAHPLLVPLLAVVTAVLLVLGAMRARRGGLAWRALAGVAGPFVAMLAWAGASIPFHHHIVLFNRFGPLQVMRLPMVSLVMPLVEAVLAVIVAAGVVLMIGRARLPRALWRFFLVLTVATLADIGWQIIIRQVFVRRADGRLLWRASTQLGGQAVYHVALLVGIGVAADAVRRRRHVRLSWFMAVALSCAVVVSGSRAGLICLALLWVALFFWRSALRRTSRRRLVVLGALVVVVALVGLTALIRLRGSGLVDRAREQTWKVAWRAFSQDPVTAILGRGYATVWPWFATETGVVPGDIHGMRPGLYGESLAHAHCTLIQVVGELGLVGLGLLVATLVLVAVRCVRGIRRGRCAGTCLGLLATFPALLLDTYLVKNFQTSLVWWLVALAVTMLVGRRRT